MQRLHSLNEIYQKRTIRPQYAQHQATPYAAGMDASLFNTDGSIRIPLTGDTTPLNTRTANAATLVGQTLNTAGAGSLMPGMVMVKTTGEFVTVATGVAGANANTGFGSGNQPTFEQPFGLLANWVGGDFDEIGVQNVGSGNVGVWKGPDSTYTILAPAYNDSGLASAVSGSGSGGAQPGAPIYLYAGNDGRLKYLATPGNCLPVAMLLDRVNATRIVVSLLV